MKILYVTNTRLPTERPNGLQIAKTCEGLALAGADIELWHADRLQGDPELRRRDLLDHYSIATRFPTRRIGSFDLIRYERLFNGRIAPVLGSLQSGFWAASMARAIRRVGTDVCYTRDTAVALVLTAVGVPVIYEHHHPKRRRVARVSLEAIGRDKTNPAVVALSEMLRTELVGYGVPPAKAHVIRHAIDPTYFSDTAGRAESRSRVGLPPDRPIVGYVGGFRTLGMEKGIAELIEAIGQLGPVGGEEPLLVCVGGPLALEAQYRELATRRGVSQNKLVFVDRVPHAEVPRWVRAFDVAAIPFPATHHFATVSPLKLVEYLAAGGCVMATDLPSIREEVDDGEDAWLVSPGVPGMVSGLQQLLASEDLRDRLAANGRARAASRTWCNRGAEIIRVASPDASLHV